MRRRPWPIVILAVFQVFFEPVSNIILNAWFSHTTIRVYLAYFIEKHEWLTLFYLLVLPPIMGMAVYAMKKWSYAVFVAGASWMLFKNFGLVREGALPLTYALGIYLGNIGFVAYFLLPRVHAPYLNPKLRWWESKTRFVVDWPCRASLGVESETTSLSCRVQDFSEGGIFLVSEGNIELGAPVHLRFSPPSGELLAVQAKAVFTRPVGTMTGYGMQFSELGRPFRKKIAGIARELANAGTPSRHGQPESSWSAFKTWAQRLVTTGRGLLPEMDSVSRPAAPAAATAADDSDESKVS